MGAQSLPPLAGTLVLEERKGPQTFPLSKVAVEHKLSRGLLQRPQTFCEASMPGSS